MKEGRGGKEDGEVGEKRAVCVDRKGMQCQMRVEGACKRIGKWVKSSDKGEWRAKEV